MEVTARITNGAEAARIKAEAQMRYEEIKEVAYQEALANAAELKDVVVITEEAGENAELRQQEEDNKASYGDI